MVPRAADAGAPAIPVGAEVGVWWTWLACARPNGEVPVAPPPAQTVAERFGDWPFLSAIDAPRTLALTGGGELSTDAATCGGCHPEHHAEWAGSTHARAMRDLQYVAELAKPDQPRWLCLNCHIPTRPQRETVVDGSSRFAVPGDVARLVPAPEPSFDPARVAEGVGCATCHVRRGPDGRGLVVGPRGSGRAPHAVVADRASLDGICERCHSPGPARLTPTFTCWFETREEIEAGPDAGKSCPECHMPEMERPAAAGGPVVTLRRHWWTGGGVPKTKADLAALADRGYTPAVDVEVDPGPPVRVTLTQARGGHRVPTADPERHLRVTVRVVGADGRVVAEDAVRIGQTWDWGDAATGRPARRLSDDRLLPGESRRLFSPVLGTGAPGERLVVEVAHVRVSEATVPHLAAAVLDDELRRLWPEAEALLPAFAEHYPLETTFFREEIPLDGGPRTRAALPDLLREAAGR
jgi:hypothetical protein